MLHCRVPSARRSVKALGGILGGLLLRRRPCRYNKVSFLWQREVTLLPSRCYTLQ